MSRLGLSTRRNVWSVQKNHPIAVERLWHKRHNHTTIWLETSRDDTMNADSYIKVVKTSNKMLRDANSMLLIWVIFDNLHDVPPSTVTKAVTPAEPALLLKYHVYLLQFATGTEMLRL